MKAIQHTPHQPDALIPPAVRIAIADAARTGAWDRKPRTVSRFRIVGHYGEGAELVVPSASWWAFRSAEKDADRHAQGRPQGGAV